MIVEGLRHVQLKKNQKVTTPSLYHSIRTTQQVNKSETALEQLTGFTTTKRIVTVCIALEDVLWSCGALQVTL